MNRPEPHAPAGDFLHTGSAGTRALFIWAPSMRELAERVAVLVGEHAIDADELNLSYTVVQSGWREHPAGDHKSAGGAVRPTWTELFFGYSALVVMRPRPTSGPQRTQLSRD